ncbi:LD-carboxypeptidase [Xaviernesmea oryzae]|uniref:LD-carboxypeptidase n=1 Tax=Xaviernesmea oryzae TaxID=464029 RepID=A0A1Q9B2E3_9HYPH|nr:LD-carboxypeptidase [Xaviernesmea oryzae]OLP62168.1 LD-carboxypeptidase [Xaviernesmea oryzae]SEL89610.1 muramoyltetrapeptide carboxypeptidase [Xaviernesmea oryzae]
MPAPALRRPIILPPKLQPGDLIRFVSPASTPERDNVMARAAVLESWGFRVDIAPHAFDRSGFLAGSDDDRLADLNEAFKDPAVRAIMATRGGKGSYRIADRLDLAAVKADPKWLVGFSDITILQCALLRGAGLASLHGALLVEEGEAEPENAALLHHFLTRWGEVRITARLDEPTALLTRPGAASGPLVGGNLAMLVTAAGWMLPNLSGTILLLEAVDCQPGEVDRALTMLCKAGHLDGLAGIAIGQMLPAEEGRDAVILRVLQEHIDALGLPVLGGLPIGHGERPLTVPFGAHVRLDGEALTFAF